MGRVNRQWTALMTVGDQVRVREEGGSAAARKYAGQHGQVTDIAIGAAKVTIFVCVEGNHVLQTAFEERDVKRL
jgi:ribosomal protein L25 (general stress protein Ctc)